MKRVPIKNVFKYWDEHLKQSPDEIFVSQKYLYFVQPFLMENIMLPDSVPLTLYERQTLYHLGCFTVQVMMREYPSITQVTQRDMEAISKRIRPESGLRIGAKDPYRFLKWMDHMLSRHNQRDLLTFLWERLVGLNEDNLEELRNENAVLIFTYLKIIVEALDSASLAYN